MNTFQRNSNFFEFLLYILFTIAGLCIGVHLGLRYGLIGGFAGAVCGAIIGVIVYIGLAFFLTGVHWLFLKVSSLKRP